MFPNKQHWRKKGKRKTEGGESNDVMKVAWEHRIDKEKLAGKVLRSCRRERFFEFGNLGERQGFWPQLRKKKTDSEDRSERTSQKTQEEKRASL